MHQKLLQELFRETNLALALDLWGDYEKLHVRCEPVEQLFDLALSGPGRKPMYIELKVEGPLSEKQEREQREYAKRAQVPRAYILLGPSYFCWRSQFPRINHPAIVIGPERMADALSAELLNIEDEALRVVAKSYLDCLKARISQYQRPHPLEQDHEWRKSDLRVYRFLDEIGSYWTTAARVYAMHRRDGKDRILNPRPQRERKHLLISQTQAIVYWEIVEDLVRFKVNVAEESKARRQDVRSKCRFALLLAAAKLDEELSPIYGKTGQSMSLARLARNVRTEVLDNKGQVDGEKARQLFDRCERLLEGMLKRLPVD